MTRRAARWPCAAGVALVALSGCAADPPLQQAAPPDPPAACVLDTAALDNATKVTWTPDQSTASDTRCVYDAGPKASGPAGPAFLTVSVFARTQADAAAERELLAQLCVEGSRVDVNKADGGFVCRGGGDLVYGALVRGDQVVQVTSSAIPTSMAADTLTTAISDQLATHAVALELAGGAQPREGLFEDGGPVGVAAPLLHVREVRLVRLGARRGGRVGRCPDHRAGRSAGSPTSRGSPPRPRTTAT